MKKKTGKSNGAFHGRQNQSNQQHSWKEKPKGYSYGGKYQSSGFTSEPLPDKPDFEYDGFDELDIFETETVLKLKPKPENQPFQPMKDRLMAQNQVSEYGKLKYTVNYQLEISVENLMKIEDFIEKTDVRLEFEKHVIDFFTETTLESDNWPRFENDVRKMSSKLGGMLLVIHKFGQDPTDISIVYAKDGKLYEKKAEIVFPKFDYSELK